MGVVLNEVFDEDAKDLLMRLSADIVKRLLVVGCSKPATTTSLEKMKRTSTRANRAPTTGMSVTTVTGR
jgi:hypothetical protein